MPKTGSHAAKSDAEKNKANTTHKYFSGGMQQEKTQESDADRNSGMAEKKLPAFHKNERHFELLLDGVPYAVQATPFLFNDEWRFRVTVNGDEGHIFTWDSETSMIRGIDDDSATLPLGLEEAISEKLQIR